MSRPKKVGIFYHDDPDGWLSGYLAYHHSLPGETLLVELHPINYGNILWTVNLQDPTQNQFIVTDLVSYILEAKFDMVYLLDFSLDPESAIKLFKNFPSVIWLDHHMTSMYALQELEEKGLRYLPNHFIHVTPNLVLGACYLALFNLVPKPFHQRLLRLVTMIAEYDVWRYHDKEDKKEKVALVSFMQRHKPYMQALQLEELVDNLDVCIEEGRRYYQEIIQERIESLQATAKYTDLTFGDKKYLALVGAVNHNSLVFEEFEGDSPKAEVYVAVKPNGEEGYVVSLYCSPGKKLSLVEIAEAFGGGGHPCACGFSIEQLTALKSFLDVDDDYLALLEAKLAALKKRKGGTVCT